MRIVIIVAALLAIAIPAHADFNANGVWEAVVSDTLSPGESVSFGPQLVWDRQQEYNVVVYRTGSDSTLATLTLYGLMNYAYADTLKRVQIHQTAIASAAASVALADTLADNENFPFMQGVLANNDGDSTAVFSVYIFAREADRMILRMR